jgi:microcystin-dependent protein
MKSLSHFLFCILMLSATIAKSQNVGVGTTTPGEKLDVSGKVRANALILSSGGSQYDFLMKSNASGEVGFRKAHGGLGLNYIICAQGSIPVPGGQPLTTPFLGQIKLFAGNFAPSGWFLCQGQLLVVSQWPDLFSILGSTYGGNGQTTFALPDLRGAAAVGSGTSFSGGYQWALGEKTN